jgi:hypothetical protein
MGMIRKALFAGTLGAVAPSSKKQRIARQTLAAVQGKSEAEVARTGTRRGALYGTAPRERHGGLAYALARQAERTAARTGQAAGTAGMSQRERFNAEHQPRA